MAEPILRGGSVVVASPEQVSSDLSGEAVILDLRSGSYFSLEAVGARIWELLREPRTPDQIASTLCDEYEVDPRECERDVLTLLLDLARAGLIEVRAGSAA